MLPRDCLLVSDVNDDDDGNLNQYVRVRERQIERVIRAKQASTQQTTQLEIPVVRLPFLSAGSTSHLICVCVCVCCVSVQPFLNAQPNTQQKIL